jgi:hypothetical protein
LGGRGDDKIKKIKLDDGQLLLTVTDKRQTRPIVREGAKQRQHSEIQTINIWSQVPEWARYLDVMTD